MIEWAEISPDTSVLSGHEGKYFARLCLTTFFWHIAGTDGKIVASGTGVDLVSAQWLIQSSIANFVGRDKIKEGNYPPGVPRGGG